MLEMIKKKLDELTKTVKKQNDEQIKFRRAYEDQINNLDEDNIPKLSNVIETNTKNGQAIAAVVSSDGAGGYKADASLILQSINGQSSATLRADKVDFNAGTYTVGADHISLAGKTINMTSDNIKIASTNFNVDRTGKATMNAAVIKKGCILGSDITKGAGIQIGSQYTDGTGCKSDVKIYVNEDASTADGVQKDIRGITIKSRCDLESAGNDIGGNVEINPLSTGFTVNDDPGTFMGFQRESGHNSYLAMKTTRATIEVHDVTEIDGEVQVAPYIKLAVGNVYLRISSSGITCGNGTTTKTLL